MSVDERDDSTTVPGETEAVEGEVTSSAADSSAELEALREERDRLKDQLLRTAADFDNFRKRSRKETEDADRRGREETVRELLPVFDNLERAVEVSASASDVTSIIEGLRMVMKLFEDQLQRVGIERIRAIGERFDPSLHDAIQQQEVESPAPGTVLAEVMAGYKLGDRLVRPAMVVVARKPSASA